LVSDKVRTIGFVLVLAALSSAVCGAALSLLVPDFAPDIERVLVSGLSVQSRGGGLDLVEDGQASVLADFLSGMRFVVFGVLVFGLPLALCASTLATRTQSVQWDPSWRTVFQAAFVLQLSCLAFAACGWLLIASEGTGFVLAFLREAPWIAALLAGDVLASVLALPSWRVLQGSTAIDRPASVSIASR